MHCIILLMFGALAALSMAEAAQPCDRPDGCGPFEPSMAGAAIVAVEGRAVTGPYGRMIHVNGTMSHPTGGTPPTRYAPVSVSPLPCDPSPAGWPLPAPAAQQREPAAPISVSPSAAALANYQDRQYREMYGDGYLDQLHFLQTAGP